MAFRGSTVSAGLAYLSVKVKQAGRMKPPNLDNAVLTAIGKEMVAEQLARWAKGINADGAPAKPLSKKYTFIKKYVTGKHVPIRDNYMTGALVHNFQLRKATDGVIRAEPTQRMTRQHSIRSDLYVQMTGFSPPETVKILKNVGEGYQKYINKGWQPTTNA